jgi:hypothetical protein
MNTLWTIAQRSALVVITYVGAGLGTISCRQYTPAEHSLVAVHSAAHGLALADQIVAPRCGVASPAPECQRFVDAYAVMRASLLVAERAADDWRRLSTVASACIAREALRGARGDIDAVLALLASFRVAVPDEVSSALRTIASIANQLAPQCGGAP